MIERATSPANIASMLETLRALQAQAADAPGAAAVDRNRIDKPGFAEMVKGAINNVNGLQMQARDLQSAYERGDNIPLTDVVLGMQKSSLAFEATLQIRNKVLKAYEDILNMPV